MTALCRSYESHAEAQRAVSEVLGLGIPGDGVRVLMGEGVRDARAETTGEFAGEAEPDAPVGTFAGAPTTEAASTGAFAGGEQRGGSFADADRDVVSDYPGGVERMRITSHHNLQRLLTDAGLDEKTAERDVRALHEGRILVLVNAPDADAERAQAALEA
jgi:hypothetical protein